MVITCFFVVFFDTDLKIFRCVRAEGSMLVNRKGNETLSSL